MSHVYVGDEGIEGGEGADFRQLEIVFGGLMPFLGCCISRPTQADLMPGFEAVPHHWVGLRDRGGRDGIGALGG